MADRHKETVTYHPPKYIPTRRVFTTCARMTSLKQINLEQLSEASMITWQTDSVVLFANISMGFQDGYSTLLQDRGRVRRNQVSLTLQKDTECARWNLRLTGVVCCCQCRLLSGWDPLDALGSSGLQGLPCIRWLWEEILRSSSKADRTPQRNRIFVSRSFKMNDDEMFCNVTVCSTQSTIYIYIQKNQIIWISRYIDK